MAGQNWNNRRLVFIRCCLALGLLCLPKLLMAQNLEKIGKKDMVTIHGGLNFSSIFYHAQGFTARRDPFSWFFSSNITVSILDVSLPFTYSYSNNQATYTQPFNMQSCSPTYKWIKGHVGTTALNFSPYTLGGHVFSGAGLELSPKGFYVGGMYGRLKKKVEYDFNAPQEMSFKRMGYAAKLGYDKNGNTLGLTYFAAKDDPNSLVFLPPESQVTPMQNTAISVGGKVSLWKKLILESEFAVSGLTRNVLAQDETIDAKAWQAFFLPNKTTTQFFRAWKAALGFNATNFGLQLKYEHVDPEYQTLGAYFFNNNFENFTLAPSMRLFKGKLNINLNSGLQFDNLDRSELATTKRWVGSASVSFAPSSKWMFVANYSNFTSFTNVRLPSDPFWVASPLDSLNFTQLSQNASSTVSHNFGKKKIKHGITLTATWQETAQKLFAYELAGGTTVLNGNLGWSMQHTPSKTGGSLSFNYNQSQLDTLLTQFMGPGFNLTKAFYKGMIRTTFGTVYNRALTQRQLSNHVLSSRASFAFSPKIKDKKYGKPSLGFNTVYINRFPVDTTSSTTAEFTGTLNLTYSF
jgi:hypothetical protein